MEVSHFITQTLVHFLILQQLFFLQFFPLLYNSGDIIKYVSHTMDHSSKCKPFTGQCGLEHNKVIKCDVVEVGLKREKGFVVRVSYGPSRSSKIQ